MHVRRMRIGEVAGRTRPSVRTIRLNEESGPAEQRVTGLHGSCSTAATFAAHLRQQIEGLQLLPEARR